MSHESEPITTEDLMQYFNRLIPPEMGSGLKVFIHEDLGLKILVGRRSEFSLLALIIKKLPESEIEITEKYRINPSTAIVIHGLNVSLPSLLDGYRTLASFEDEEIDLSSQRGENDKKKLKKLRSIIEESVRVHPYTREPIPHNEEVEIDEAISRTMSSMDNALKQVEGLAIEGVSQIEIGIDFDEKGGVISDIRLSE